MFPPAFLQRYRGEEQNSEELRLNEKAFDEGDVYQILKRNCVHIIESFFISSSWLHVHRYLIPRQTEILTDLL